VRLFYPIDVSRAVLRSPTESWERALEKFAARADRADSWRPDEPDPNAAGQIHKLLGAPWPCGELDEFERVWESLNQAVAGRGYAIGRGAFGGWDDGDAGLARTVWCLTRHLSPDVVVETGVARGFTSATILHALALNRRGHLWSIDLPPLVDRRIAAQTGAAVPASQHDRWTLVRGSSRKMLRPLIAEVGQVGLFVHDSMHTGRNVSFELQTVWPALQAGGAALIDDIQQSAAFGRFAEANSPAEALTVLADDGQALFGCLIKAFGPDPFAA